MLIRSIKSISQSQLTQVVKLIKSNQIIIEVNQCQASRSIDIQIDQFVNEIN
jgi:predicted Zn-dependent protease